MTDLTFVDSLRAIVSGRGVVTEASDLETYNIDWRDIYHEKARRVKHALDPSGLMNPGKVLALISVENVENVENVEK